MTKPVDDPTTTDIDDPLISIEGEYIGPGSSRWTRLKGIALSLSDEEKERP